MTKTKRLCSLAIAVVALSLGHARAWAAADFRVGVCIHAGQNRLKASQAEQMLDFLGTQHVRDEVLWGRIEKEKGVLSYPASFNELDKIITDTVAKGGRPILILDYGNKFYDDGDGVGSDEGRAAFARYAAFVAEHFKGRVNDFEVWNEWNIGLGSNKKPRTVRSVDDYIKLLKVTYTALKKEDPKLNVIGGVVAGTEDRWIKELIEKGGAKYLDSLSVHPYVIWRPRNRPEDAIAWLDKLNDYLVQATGHSIPLYVTEIGWPNNQGKFSWTLEQSSDYISRMLLLARTRDYLRGVWIYELLNLGNKADDKEYNFGVFMQDAKPKPSAETLKEVISMLAQTSEAKQLPTPPNEYVVRYTLKNGNVCTGRWVRYEEDRRRPPGEMKGKLLMGRGNPGADQLPDISESPLIVCK